MESIPNGVTHPPTSLNGHLWTIAPVIRSWLGGQPIVPAEPFHAELDDPRVGRVRLSGLLSEHRGSEALVVVLHGLAGNAESPYCAAAARAALRAGMSALRLSMRGADLSGEDIYHAGLVDDVRVALSSPKLDRYRTVFLLGYSFGGHLALRAAIELGDPRVRAVGALSPPLDLAVTMRYCDRPVLRPYRRWINSGLNRAYAVTEARGRAPIPLRVLRRARYCSEWNQLAIVPRFGFRDVQDYYDRASVAGVLHRLRTPALMIASRQDPIVPPHTVRDTLARAPAALDVRWVDTGGHVYLPPGLDLGLGGTLGAEGQVLGWFCRT